MTPEQDWTILYHPLFIDQINKVANGLTNADLVALTNAKAKTLAQISKTIFERIAANPGAEEFRQGKTLGDDYKHWRRAKFGGRFRLFFRYDSDKRIIVIAWVNDENTKRKAGDKNDPYALFRKMLDGGDPPDAFDDLKDASTNKVPAIFGNT